MMQNDFQNKMMDQAKILKGFMADQERKFGEIIKDVSDEKIKNVLNQAMAMAKRGEAQKALMIIQSLQNGN